MNYHDQAGSVGMLAELADLVLPVTCVCCRRPGSDWCESCRLGIGMVQTKLTDGLPVVSAGEYVGTLRTSLLAFKERGRRRLVEPLAGLLAVALAELVAGPAPVLVAVPSRRAAARERGGDHVSRLAKQVGRICELEVCLALTLSGRVHDSAGLTTTERIANLHGRMRAQPPVLPRPVVVVDDIVTTGATLSEANRALTVAGWTVLGGATIAATRRRWQPARSGLCGRPEGEPSTTIL